MHKMAHMVMLLLIGQLQRGDVIFCKEPFNQSVVFALAVTCLNFIPTLYGHVQLQREGELSFARAPEPAQYFQYLAHALWVAQILTCSL